MVIFCQFQRGQQTKQPETVDYPETENSERGASCKCSSGKENATLQSELTAAQTAVTQIDFLTSAESIKYDGILFSIAADANLQITSLSATAPADTTENSNSYQLTTFTVNVAGVAPQKVFASTADSTAYIAATVNNILAFTHEVANSSDFDTAEMPSVSLTSSVPMTDDDIATLNAAIGSEVQAGLTTAETQGLTSDQITALAQSKLAKNDAGTDSGINYSGRLYRAGGSSYDSNLDFKGA